VKVPYGAWRDSDLIAFERRKQRATEEFRSIVRRGLLPIVPAMNASGWATWRNERWDQRSRRQLLAERDPPGEPS